MKIVENTRGQLVLEDRPLLLGVLLAGVILVVLAFAMIRLVQGDLSGLWLVIVAAGFGLGMVIFVRRTRVIFDRAAGVVLIRVATLRGETVQTLPLATLSAAQIETRSSKSGRGNRRVVMMHRPVLAFADQSSPMPLMQVFVAGSGAADAVEAINAWLKGG